MHFLRLPYAYWLRRDEITEFVKLAKQLAHKIKAPNRDDPRPLVSARAESGDGSEPKT